jgi:hypothetical protein
VESGLRLSQENEVLRKELERLRQAKENIGPRMNANEPAMDDPVGHPET